jgi:hypothetical protein
MDAAQAILTEKHAASISSVRQSQSALGSPIVHGKTKVLILGLLAPFLVSQLFRIQLAQRYQTASATESALVAIPFFFVL